MLLYFNNKLTTSSRIFLVCLVVNRVSTALADNYPVAPYGSLQVGPTAAIDWDENFQNKFSFSGMALLGSAGCLWSPAQLDNWLVSLESCYHRRLTITQSSLKEHGIFLVGKLSFSHAERLESFWGIGLGGLSLSDLSKEEKNQCRCAAALGTAGVNWYLDKGCYLTLRGTYIQPIGDSLSVNALKNQTTSLLVGLHWNWM